MKISNYLNHYKLDYDIQNNHNVSKITDYTNDVVEDSIFVAIKGYTKNGADYIDEVIHLGAKTIIYDQNINFIKQKGINYIYVLDTKIEMSRLLKWYYRNKKIPFLIGVTGTNGKTSTTSYVYQLIKAKNKNVLLFGTGYIKSFNENDEIIKKTKNTTINLSNIYKYMFAKSYDYVIMEVSSQGIMEGRILGLEFDIVCFTNITQDHLDYHNTMDNYANAKSRLIYNLKKTGILILNQNMDYFDCLKQITLSRTITYSTTCKNANYTLFLDEYSNNLIKFNINFNKNKYYFETYLFGSFNLENLLASLVIINSIFNNFEDFKEEVKKLSVARGRMNLYKLNNFYVLIDFAHTPDGVFKVLNDLKKYNFNRIITILGCGGNKDKLKRPLMGHFASEYSDIAIFTEDNSRGEDTMNIISDMIKSVDKKNYHIFAKRMEAIDYALNIAKKNDIIALLGKGSEVYIERDEIIPFSDISYIEEKGGVRVNE